jgi:nucleoside-diphosphate-sugar epimerase
MSMLVTGASGFLGTAVVGRLFARGIPKVRCFVRPTSQTAYLEEVSRTYAGCDIEYVVGNLISSQDCRRALQGVSTVFHIAAQMKGAPAAMFLNTVVTSSRLLDAIQESPVERMVLISSLSVYGPRQDATTIVDENSEIEPEWRKRDPYSQTKLWQESLFHEAQKSMSFDLQVLRPGVIYGARGDHFSGRVGVKMGDCLWLLGRNNILPLTYVENCADAIVFAGLKHTVTGCYNVVDDDLPTAAEYVRAYKEQVGDVRSIWFPWWLTMAMSKAVESYSEFSHRQIPPALTPYKSAVLWRGLRFDNRKLKSIGWKQLVPTAEALIATFRHWHCCPVKSRTESVGWRFR